MKYDAKFNSLKKEREKCETALDKAQRDVEFAKQKMESYKEKMVIADFKKSIGRFFMKKLDSTIEKTEEFISIIGFSDDVNLGLIIMASKGYKQTYVIRHFDYFSNLLYAHKENYKEISKKEFDKNYNEILSIIEDSKIISRDIILEKSF